MREASAYRPEREREKEGGGRDNGVCDLKYRIVYKHMLLALCESRMYSLCIVCQIISKFTCGQDGCA